MGQIDGIAGGLAATLTQELIVGMLRRAIGSDAECRITGKALHVHEYYR